MDTKTISAASVLATLTDKERAVIIAICDSEYRSREEGDYTETVWSTTLCAGLSTRSMGGVFASLAAKNIIGLGGRGKESTVVFTAMGLALAKVVKAEVRPAREPAPAPAAPTVDPRVVAVGNETVKPAADNYGARPWLRAANAKRAALATKK